MTLVLASGSATRAALLTAAGVPFIVDTPAIDEPRLRQALEQQGVGAGDIALALAAAKAEAVSKHHPNAWVLGADQILEFDGQCLGKVTNMAAAHTLLMAMCGRTHCLYSAAVLSKGGQTSHPLLVTATLTMRQFSPDFLERYLADEGDGLLASVGCYHLEGRGLQLFSAIDGDYFAILGLPLLPLLGSLRTLGILNT